MRVGKKYRRQDYSDIVYTCEAILSNGDAAFTYTVNDKVYSVVLVKKFFDYYEEVPDEDWRAIFRDDGELKIGICTHKSEQSVIDSWGSRRNFVKAVKVSP